jgi:hypothetical protein
MSYRKCINCICKTCLIAESNGGAPGCGDCDYCINNNYYWFNNNCSDYMNTSPPNISIKEGEQNEKE